MSRRRRAHERVRGMSEVPKAPSESAGEGVAERSVRVSRDRRIHTTTVVHVLGRVWLSGVRMSRGRVRHTVTPTATDVQNRLGREWLIGVRMSHGRVRRTVTTTTVTGDE